MYKCGVSMFLFTSISVRRSRAPRLVNSIGAAQFDTVCLCVCVCEPYKWNGGQGLQKIAFKEATDDPPDTHSRFWVARAHGSLFEFVDDLKYRSAPREYLYVKFGCESVAERTYWSTSKGVRPPRCVDGRWSCEMAVCGPQIKSPNAHNVCVRVRVEVRVVRMTGRRRTTTAVSK